MAGWLRAAESFLNKIDEKAAGSLRRGDADAAGRGSESEDSDAARPPPHRRQYHSDGQQPPLAGSNGRAQAAINVGAYHSDPRLDAGPGPASTSGNGSAASYATSGRARLATRQPPLRAAKSAKEDDWGVLLGSTGGSIGRGDQRARDAPSSAGREASGSLAGTATGGAQGGGGALRSHAASKGRSQTVLAAAPAAASPAAAPGRPESVTSDAPSTPSSHIGADIIDVTAKPDSKLPVVQDTAAQAGRSIAATSPAIMEAATAAAAGPPARPRWTSDAAHASQEERQQQAQALGAASGGRAAAATVAGVSEQSAQTACPAPLDGAADTSSAAQCAVPEATGEGKVPDGGSRALTAGAALEDIGGLGGAASEEDMHLGKSEDLAEDGTMAEPLLAGPNVDADAGPMAGQAKEAADSLPSQAGNGTSIEQGMPLIDRHRVSAVPTESGREAAEPAQYTEGAADTPAAATSSSSPAREMASAGWPHEALGKDDDLIAAYIEGIQTRGTQSAGEMSGGDVDKRPSPLDLPPRQGRRGYAYGAPAGAARGGGGGPIGISTFFKAGRKSSDTADKRLQQLDGDGASRHSSAGEEEEEEDDDDESASGTTMSSDDEEDSADEAVARAAAAKEEADQAAALARRILQENLAASAAAVALQEQEQELVRLEEKREGIKWQVATAAEEHAKEIAKLRESMLEGMQAVQIEKHAHSGTRLEAVQREASLETETLDHAKALAAAQRALDEKVAVVRSLQMKIETAEIRQAVMEQEVAEAESSIAQLEQLRHGGLAQDGIHDTQQASLKSDELEVLDARYEEVQQQVLELEAQLHAEQSAQRQPSALEIDLQQNLKQLTDQLIQKQSQVEALASEKATLTLRLEVGSLASLELGMTWPAVNLPAVELPTITNTLEEESAAALLQSKRRKAAAAILDQRDGDDEDPEYGLTRTSTPSKSRRAAFAVRDFGLGAAGNAVVRQVSLLALGLDSLFLGGARYLRGSSSARAMLAGYLCLLHAWVLLVWLMSSHTATALR
eukprot:SM000034S12794  [mRNA]  locus=s34:850688:855633:+ [translate_table: standard]